MITMRKIFDILPLRKKAFIGFSLIIVFIGLLSLISFFSISNTHRQFNVIYMNLSILDEYSEKIEEINNDLNNYINLNDRSYISTFNQGHEELLLEMKTSDILFIENDEKMLFENLKNMLISYIKVADSVMNEYRKRNLEISSNQLIHSQKIQAYMQEGIDELTLKYVSQSKKLQSDLLMQLNTLKIVIIVLTLSVIILYSSIIFYFSKAFIKPIDLMVKMANRISRGEFDTERIKIHLNSELKILAETLFKMSIQIKNYIQEIEKKVEVEKLLQSKEMENMRINALLQETELKRLQAQVNPHFLFNTLTTLHHTAFLEGAEETCEITEAISKMLRYNLRKSNTIVQLKDEIESIGYYLYIQEKRYKQRVKFKLNIDEDQLDLPIPNMTIQPIVENSFIHGIENKENGGEIIVSVYKDLEYVVVEIRDNGLGIEKQKLERIRDLIEEPEENRAHTSSIGINNVVKRLQAFYNMRSKFYIEAAPNEGTIIKLFLPADFEYRRPASIDDKNVFMEEKL